MRALRQDTSWALFVQPGPHSALQLLFKVRQTWKENQKKGSVNRALRSALITCMMEHMEHLLKIPQKMSRSRCRNERTPKVCLRRGRGNTKLFTHIGSPVCGKRTGPSEQSGSGASTTANDPPRLDTVHGEQVPCKSGVHRHHAPRQHQYLLPE